jgi:hypothetical protein
MNIGLTRQLNEPHFIYALKHLNKSFVETYREFEASDRAKACDPLGSPAKACNPKELRAKAWSQPPHYPTYIRELKAVEVGDSRFFRLLKMYPPAFVELSLFDQVQLFRCGPHKLELLLNLVQGQGHVLCGLLAANLKRLHSPFTLIPGT